MVYKGDRKHLIFKQSANGLFYHDLDNREFCMVETVDENKKYFSERAYKRAVEARKLYQIIGISSINDFKAIAQGNLIKNCPITIDDIKVAEKILERIFLLSKGRQPGPQKRQ